MNDSKRRPQGIQVPCVMPRCRGQVLLVKRSGGLLMGDCVACGRTFARLR